jgi:UDP-N-acetylglucosamine--N-acetylmuramyl-(pentapeptide) pyrophosphoryl-undecaprenol N-acetylglucosamine transferase
MMSSASTQSEISFGCLIAGGGTGGHLFPGIAVAREVERRFERARILFVVGRRKMESEIMERHGYSVDSIDVEGLKGRGWKKGLSTAFRLPRSLFQSAVIIRRFSPSCVLGMGGYSAGPVCVAARFLGRPTAIHEQNSFPGLTNRLLSRIADRVFVSFEESRPHLGEKNVILTGNPVRSELFAESGGGRKTGAPFTVLVVGGSQGAKALNQSFADALAYLRGRGRNIEVVHQTGETDYDRVKEDYRNRGLEGDVIPFIQDMATGYGRADLVVSRAGATTIFELAALGKPSILIPYPYAANRHQEINALSLVKAGGAEMVRQRDLTGKVLARIIMKYMHDPAALEHMGRQVRSMARPDAAKAIVDQLVEMTAP